MSPLEARYRAALRWYPRSWREANADALVGVLLDVAEAEGRREPRRADLLDLAVSGVATRVGVVVDRRARGVIAANAIATGLAYSLVTTFTTSWAPLAPVMRHGFFVPTFGPFIDLGPILAALWILAAVGALLGRAVIARSAAVALVLTVIAMEVVHTIHPVAGSLSQYGLAFHAALAALSLVGVVGRPRALGLLLAGWLAVFVTVDVATDTWISQSSIYLWSIGPANAAGLTMALAGACLVASAQANLRRPDSAAVVLLSTLPWVLLWALELVTNPRDYFEFPFPLYAAGLLLATYTVTVVLLRRSRRRASRAV